MIFMKFFARSSRTTGPKIRVPTGSFVVVQNNGRIAVEADGGAVFTTDLFGGAHDDGLTDVPFFNATRAEWLPSPRRQ